MIKDESDKLLRYKFSFASMVTVICALILGLYTGALYNGPGIGSEEWLAANDWFERTIKVFIPVLWVFALAINTKSVNNIFKKLIEGFYGVKFIKK